MYAISLCPANHPDITPLIAALDAFQQQLYPAESNHLLDLNPLAPDALILMIIRDAEQHAVGCGAVVLHGDGSGEMKRVYIDPEHRGQRLGQALLAALENEARARHCHTLRLETGIHQPAAATLYTRNGYVERDAFTPYRPDPLSIFMEKSLIADLRQAM
ncbi:GNAT family N-acetyltransferase [Enterobacteriaceae bacterium RIT691]|nr:GNAT family N-acetyltransferase [Enterobacteriaceae bacterium RIT691]